MKKIYLLLLAALTCLAANATDWYLVGANYGWSNNANYKFTDNGDGTQSLTVDKLAGQIKIKEAGTWNTSFGANEDSNKLYKDVTYQAKADGNNIAVDGIIAYATITINPSTYTILVTGATGENEYDTVYLVGDFGSSWSESITSYPLTLKDGTEDVWVGTYTLTAETTYFKMKAGSFIYATGGGDVAVQSGVNYTAYQSGNAFSLGAGEYNFSFTLVKNADTGTLVVTTEGGGSDIDYSEWYVNVLFEKNEWADNGVHPTAEGVATFTNLAIGNGAFIVKVYNGTDMFYRSPGYEIPLNTWTTLSTVDGEPNAYIEGASEDSSYDVEFDIPTAQIRLTLTGTSGLESVSVEAQAVEYFNLQGMRVENPSNGIFIRRQGSSVSKVAL